MTEKKKPSILETLKAQAKAKRKGFFCAIGGPRMSGKTTISGTLKGKTLLIQVKSLEAGNSSAEALATELGNELIQVEVSSRREMEELLRSEDILVFDNIYVDGFSAYTELLYGSEEFSIISERDPKKGGGVWPAFAMVQDRTTDLITLCKSLAEDHNKNVFVTYALRTKEGEVQMVSKGQASKDLIDGKSTNVVVVLSKPTEDGMERRILTTNKGPYSARLGNILDKENPGLIEADLNTLIKVAKGEKV